MKRISIDPITRLEGHGRIDLFLNEDGGLENAYMVIPELRGFEKFCEGRPVEEMPRIILSGFVVSVPSPITWQQPRRGMLCTMLILPQPLKNCRDD